MDTVVDTVGPVQLAWASQSTEHGLAQQGESLPTSSYESSHPGDVSVHLLYKGPLLCQTPDDCLQRGVDLAGIFMSLCSLKGILFQVLISAQESQRDGGREFPRHILLSPPAVLPKGQWLPSSPFSLENAMSCSAHGFSQVVPLS